MRNIAIIQLCLMALLTSCGDTENEFSSYRCYLVFQKSEAKRS